MHVPPIAGQFPPARSRELEVQMAKIKSAVKNYEDVDGLESFFCEVLHEIIHNHGKKTLVADDY